MEETKHFVLRLRQRGISYEQAAFVYAYGITRPAHGKKFKVIMNQQAYAQAYHEVNDKKFLKKCLNIVLIASHNNRFVTAYYSK